VLILTYPNIITDNYTHHLYSRCRWCEDWATQPIHSSHIYPAGPPPITPHSHFTPLSLFTKKKHNISHPYRGKPAVHGWRIGYHYHRNA